MCCKVMCSIVFFALSFFLVILMLQISTYNCQSSKRNTGGIQKLCEHSDVVFLQEHWLFPDDLSTLNNIHNDFVSFALSSMDPSSELLTGRPFGGVAVLWRKSLAPFFRPISFDDDRIIGLEFNRGGVRMLFLGVYLPYCSHQNFDRFVYYLAKLKSIIDDFETPHVCVLGDFNADMVKATEFGKELESFCIESRLFVVDAMHLPSDSKTHVNDGHGTESWLDHIVCTEGFLELVSNIVIDQSILSSDHLPVTMKISCESCDYNHNDSTGQYADKRWVVEWDSLTVEDLSAFESVVKENLDKICVPSELLHCSGCSSVEHRDVIASYYDQVIACLSEASNRTIGKALDCNARNVVPGWNDFVKDNHTIFKDVYALWALIGKPRGGYIFDQLRLARSRFKLSLRYCLRNEKELRAKSLADKLI